MEAMGVREPDMMHAVTRTAIDQLFVRSTQKKQIKADFIALKYCCKLNLSEKSKSNNMTQTTLLL